MDSKRSGMLLLAVLALCAAFRSSLCAQDIKEQRIQHIRQVFQRINSDHSLKVVSLDQDEFSEETTDGGAELKGYFKGDSLCKMTLWVGLSYGALVTDYYFDRGSIVFIYEVQMHFPHSDTSTDFGKLQTNFEGRYYLKSGKLIDRIVKGKLLFDEQADAKRVKEMMDKANGLADSLRKHGPSNRKAH
jgi:hypothetical protein